MAGRFEQVDLRPTAAPSLVLRVGDPITVYKGDEIAYAGVIALSDDGEELIVHLIHD